MVTVADGEAIAARLVVAGRHRLVGDEEIVQAAGTGHAELERRFEQRHALVEQFSRVIERHRLQEGFRRQAGPAGEELLQPGRGLADIVRQCLQRRLVAVVEADLLDDAAHGLVVASCGRDVLLEDRGYRHAGIHRHKGVHGNVSLALNIAPREALLHPIPAAEAGLSPTGPWPSPARAKMPWQNSRGRRG